MGMISSLLKILRPQEEVEQPANWRIIDTIRTPRKDTVVVEYRNPKTGETVRTGFVILAD